MITSPPLVVSTMRKPRWSWRRRASSLRASMRGVSGPAQLHRTVLGTNDDGRARGPARGRSRVSGSYQLPPALQPPFPAVVQVRVTFPSVALRVIVNTLPVGSDFSETT